MSGNSSAVFAVSTQEVWRHDLIVINASADCSNLLRLCRGNALKIENVLIIKRRRLQSDNRSMEQTFFSACEIDQRLSISIIVGMDTGHRTQIGVGTSTYTPMHAYGFIQMQSLHCIHVVLFKSLAYHSSCQCMA